MGLLLAAVFAAPASAAVVTRPGHGRVTTRGLSAAEQRAITVASMSLTGDDSVGTYVRVTFRGDVERYLGRGHLRAARLALVLIPAHGGQLSGLVDQGHGAAERVLPFTAARPAGAVRHRHQVTFYLADARLSHFSKIELKVLATGAAHVSWRQILAARPTTQISLPVNATKLTCSQLTALAGQLGSLGDSAQVRRALRTVRAKVGGARLAACTVPASAAPPTTTTTATDTTAGETPTPVPPSPPISVVQTDAALSQQLTPQPGLSFASAPPAGDQVIDVNDQLGYQRFGGVGAALTDSAAWLIYDELSPADRTTLMQELFGSSGIHLNFLRIAMGASGAMTVGPPYSYDDQPSGQTDPTLADFSIAHDQSYIIPTLQQALSINPGLQILANPWSPPGWMKDNDSLGNQGDSGTLIESDYQVLAGYFVKTIQDYAADGVPIEAVTPQNEPRTTGNGTTYPGLTLPESKEAQFIAQDLAPALKNAGLHTQIYGNDLSWDQSAYADGLVADPNAGPDLAGIAWHCYFGNPNVMTQLEQSAPDIEQIVDECSPEIRGFGTPEFLISSLRNWASVVSVWTAATDPSGGPIQSSNDCHGCRGLVTIDETAHTATLRTEYYQLGQVSSFVQPGARRIDSPSFVTYGVNGSNIETVSSGLDDVAFLNPDGTKVLIAYNTDQSAPISFAVESDGRYFTYTIPAQAMTTFVWR